MKLSQKLIELRKAKGLSQAALAELMNVSRQAISRWEVGTSVPSTDNLKYLGLLYDVPLDYLLNDDAPEPSHTEPGTAKDTDNIIQKKKSKFLWVIIIVAALISAILFATLFGMKDERPVPMNSLEGSVVSIISEFELDLQE